MRTNAHYRLTVILLVLVAVVVSAGGAATSTDAVAAREAGARQIGLERGEQAVLQQAGCPPTSPCVILEPVFAEYGAPDYGVGNLSFQYTGTWGAYGWNEYSDLSVMWSEAVSTGRWYAETINNEDWTRPYDNSDSYTLHILTDPQGSFASEAFARVRTKYRVKTRCPDAYPEGTPVAIRLRGDFAGYKYGVEPDQQSGKQFLEFGFTVADDLDYYDAYYQAAQLANEFWSSGGVYERHRENGEFSFQTTLEFSTAVGETFEIDAELYGERGNDNPNDWISEGTLNITVETPAVGGTGGVCPVAVDIKPGSCPNSVNTKKKGVLPVAILGSVDFDVTDIDPSTIRLTREGYDIDVAPLRWSLEDVATPFEGDLCDCQELGADGFVDLTLKFDAQEVRELGLDAAAGETVPLVVVGALNESAGGGQIAGSDCVRVLQGRVR